MRRIITVGREFGSGGREIGRRIAEELQIAYYDQEIITEIAKRTALTEAYIRQIEEKRPVVSFPIHVGHSFYLSPDPTFHPDLSIYTKQHDLLTNLRERVIALSLAAVRTLSSEIRSPFVFSLMQICRVKSSAA